MTIIECTREDAFEDECADYLPCACGAPSTKDCEWCEAPICDTCAGNQLGICKSCVRGEWQTEAEVEQSVKDALDRYLNFMGL